MKQLHPESGEKRLVQGNNSGLGATLPEVWVRATEDRDRPCAATRAMGMLGGRFA